MNYPVPRNAKDVKAFLGLASFYRRLVPKFANAAKHLTLLTIKDQVFFWGPSQQEAFEELKDKLRPTPVLDFPNFEIPFILTRLLQGGSCGHLIPSSGWCTKTHSIRQPPIEQTGTQLFSFGD
jgi:hypothetical protein